MRRPAGKARTQTVVHRTHAQKQLCADNRQGRLEGTQQQRRASEMIVYVAFEFKGIDPISPEADKIVNEINDSCETMRIGFDAGNCWIDDVIADPQKD
jgi:hypothetical protein